MKYYSLKRILERNAVYNMVIGERSNGKSYAVHEYAATEFYKNGGQLAVVRRWQDDFTGKRGATMFDGIVNSGALAKITNGEWTGIYYYSSRWLFCRYEDGKRVVNETPFAYGFAITSQEHDKSTSYPNVRTILFDEFLTRNMYLPDEFVLFCNVVSTIVRQRTDVKIFMLGNTVNKYCPYFKEMGLKHVIGMKQGTIDVYQYGDSRLTVAVEYCKSNGSEGKPSDFYFAFDNPKLNMITGGAWEIDIYPHCPTKYRPCDVRYIYFIEFDTSLLQCEVIYSDGGYFTYIHEKTTPIKNPDRDMLFTLADTSHRRNIRRNILKPEDKLGDKIAWFFRNSRVFYQDNDVGEVVANYLKCCAA